MRLNQDNPLLGVWYLLLWDMRYDDGRPTTFPFGERPRGMIIYSGDGNMSACIARPDRKPLSSESVRSAPESERLAAFESYFHYAGPYAIQVAEGQQQVVHSVAYALNPNFIGTRQVRNMHFSADGDLTLSASDTVPGTAVGRHHRLVWSRRSPA